MKHLFSNRKVCDSYENIIGELLCKRQCVLSMTDVQCTWEISSNDNIYVWNVEGIQFTKETAL